MILSEKKYDMVNNVAGWVVFAIALTTYWLTLEPTASYWDCGEYVAQASMLEIGHPPGNPIFMLLGRVFCNFASDASQYALMVNAMSGLLSAFTILFLFWTITSLVSRLVVSKGEYTSVTAILVIACGFAGSLAYTWSDTFWYSAVEAEVYAFSSFCTALVVWLALKWERRADAPHSDRYLILIAYIIGVSIAVHLLNLLCIPAIALIVAYRKMYKVNAVRLIGVLLLSFVVVGLVLFGLVPGFVKMAQQVELLCVNELHLPFNSGALIYVLLLVGLLLWALWELYMQCSSIRIRLSVLLAVTISGILSVGNGVTTMLLLSAFAVWIFLVVRKISVRICSVILWSIFVIFIGYSSYAIILIRANANPPMNQNMVDNLFSLESYLGREQYKAHPLLYGPTPYSERMKIEKESVDTLTGESEYTYAAYSKKQGRKKYVRGRYGAQPILGSGFATTEDSVRNARLVESGGDYYLMNDYDFEYVMTPELNMVLPRIFSSSHINDYKGWTGMTPENMDSVEVSDAVNADGDYVVKADLFTGEREARRLPKPTFVQNMSYLFGYQVGYMYLRYFMWNFSGRQNDLQSQGQADAGNIITGFPMIDNALPYNQALLPGEIGEDNPGYNRYYMLPLLLGLSGIVWQCCRGREGKRQALMLTVLFVMTGIAIVIYLNQTPGEPRERDYAFAGSFYAFAIWIGVGVMALYGLLRKVTRKLKHNRSVPAVAASLLGLAVPLQMLSQTADDHDRSGRTAARDYAINYLESLEPNAILFLNGDNFTFPLWYAQEVEGVRRDVRIINLAYLTTDWYILQLMQQAYEADPVPMTAKPEDVAMRRRSVCYFFDCDETPTDAVEALKEVYDDASMRNPRRQPRVAHPVITIPLERDRLLKSGVIESDDTTHLAQSLTIDMRKILSGRTSYIRIDELIMLDIIATNAVNGWQRPIYWTNISQGKELLGFTPYLEQVGMAYRLTPLHRLGEIAIDTERTSEVIKKFEWGASEVSDTPYFDETNGKMLSYQRRMLLETASALIEEAKRSERQRDDKIEEAREMVDIVLRHLSSSTYRYMTYNKNYTPRNEAVELGRLMVEIADLTGNKDLKTRGLNVLKTAVVKAAEYYRYYNSLGKRAVFTTSNTGLTARNFYMTVDAYLNAGGDMQELKKLPQLKNIDLQKAEDKWRFYYLRQTLLRDARPLTELAKLSEEERRRQNAELLHADTTMAERISEYIRLGGTIEQLSSYAEFSAFSFENYLSE